MLHSTQHYKGGTGSYNTNNYDAVQTTYNFDNQASATYRYHYVGGTQAFKIDNSYAYDQTGRKIKTYVAVNGGTSVLLSKTDYNEIGQLNTKHLHSTDSGASLYQSYS